MKYLSLLACPNCYSALLKKDETPIISWLNCQFCQLDTPVIHDFALFTESQPHGSIDRLHINKLVKFFEPNSSDYQRYIDLKYSREMLDVYAAMQPFNESTRSIYPCLSKLKGSFKPNEIIIETWSRTGWYALILSALFPEQHILALWEGNNSVLGYRGYGYWFSEGKRPKNLNIIFASPNQQLPFKHNLAKMIVAHDILHRRELEVYSDELLRVIHPDGVILAPHVHLSNSEPKPYFERGGILRHGVTYSQHYNSLIADNNRQCLVLSEQELLNYQDNRLLEDASDREHYNGFLAIAKKAWLQQNFNNEIEQSIDNFARLIPNPLLEINPISGSINLKPSGLSNRVRYYLDRHPNYAKIIQSSLVKKLDTNCIKLLIAAEQGGTIIDLARVLGWSVLHTKHITNRLREDEIIAILPIDNSAIDLQGFYTNQHSLFPQSFVDFWQNLIATTPDLFLLILDDQHLSIKEIHQLMLAICAYYLTHGIEQFNLIVIDAAIDPTKQIILMMAAWWLSLSIQVSSTTEYSIYSGDDFIVSHEFWDVIEMYIDSDFKLLPSIHLQQQPRMQSKWYKSLPFSSFPNYTIH